MQSKIVNFIKTLRFWRRSSIKIEADTTGHKFSVLIKLWSTGSHMVCLAAMIAVLLSPGLKGSMEISGGPCAHGLIRAGKLA